MNQLEQLQSSLDPILRQKAQQYLDSGKVISIKRFPDEIEGMMQERDTLLMPYYTFEEETFVCQCRQGDAMCIHKAAILLATQVMQEADCPDYHMAAKILAARKMAQTIRLK